MADFIRSHRVTVSCPECGHEHSKSLGVLERYEKNARTFRCGGCGREIAATDVGATIKKLEETIAKETAKLRKSIAKLGK